MAEIVVVGSYNQDLVFKTATFPRPGETRSGSFHEYAGGKGFNQAVSASRLEADVLFLAAVGKDEYAERLSAFCEKEGIETQLLRIGSVPTGVASIVVEESGENQIIVAHGANARLDSTWLADRLGEVGQLKIVLCQNETNALANRVALARAREAGALAVFNPAPMNASVTRELVQLSDVFIPNETEFLSLLEGETDRASDALERGDWETLNSLCRTLNVDTVIITLGSKGCFVSASQDGVLCLERGEFASYAAEKVEAVDSSGAGDSFCGAFVAGLRRFDNDLERSIRFAMTAAGLQVQKEGTAPAMPTLEEVLRTFE